MSTFLLEVGTEELPADFSRLVIPQLEELVSRDLKEKRLEHGHVYCTTTPRRIVLLVNDLAGKALDFEEDRKGPPANQAYLNGLPTKAAIGFASRLQLNVEDLEIKETSKGPFVFGKIVEKGEPAIDILQALIPSWISNLQGRRFMRWGNDERRFSRPIRWIISLIDDQVIPLVIKDTDPKIKSGRLSRGHRLYSDSISVPNAESYFTLVNDKGVNVDRDKRFSLINNLIDQASLQLNAKPDVSDELINELTDLVENPSLLIGQIDNKYLDLPSEVLCTVMKVHQRYVPLYLEDANLNQLSLHSKGIVLPKFLCICNSLLGSEDTVKRGNERVLRARLADAEFFLSLDLSIPSIKRCELLKNVTYAEGLGSLSNRVDRIIWLVELLNNNLLTNAKKASLAIKAAELSKNDLVSQMVGEFPELQGIMGGKYLLAEGYSQEIALAMSEQYLPRYSGDKLPESEIGTFFH